jgi:hypothetical protein
VEQTCCTVVRDGNDGTLENMEREMGLEPTTSSLGSWHSTTELLPLAWLLLSINKIRELGNRGLREGVRRWILKPGEEVTRSALVSARERM